MSTEEPQNDTPINAADAPTSPVESTPAPSAPAERKRPRLDLSGALGRERKRGKSMFGLVLGTLNKAKIEDKERSASEAAKKRQLIEQRLQAKLRKETDSVRRAEEARKEKSTATRKEEDLQLKDSIYKLRRTRLPILANFLLTSDIIPLDDSPPETPNPLAPVPRTHPAPLYYLPAVLTPSQQAFIDKRKAEVKEAAEKEWQAFLEERKAGIEEINTLRQRVADEEANIKKEKVEKTDVEMDTAPPAEPTPETTVVPSTTEPQEKADVEMEVEEPPPALPAVRKDDSKSSNEDKKDESVPMQADDDDAVEY